MLMIKPIKIKRRDEEYRYLWADPLEVESIVEENRTCNSPGRPRYMYVVIGLKSGREIQLRSKNYDIDQVAIAIQAAAELQVDLAT